MTTVNTNPNTHAGATSAIALRHHRRIVNADGHYLHMSGEGFVESEQYAWSGTIKQSQILALKNPSILGLSMPLVHASGKPAINEIPA